MTFYRPYVRRAASANILRQAAGKQVIRISLTSSIMRGLVLLLVLPAVAFALDNGLARTPPMGWLSWERFRCNTDCVNDPDNCISENLFMQMADRMAADGYAQAGYEYIIIDDCWLAKNRTAEGKLQPDPARFPKGIKALADYIHSKGLKFGIYEDFGTHTCGGFPGSEYYLQLDAQTFADWGVDYLKLDGCYSNPNQYDDAYPAMSMWLNRTGRPILFSCSWPAYQESGSIKPDFKRVSKACNMARNFHDVQDSWASITSIIAFYGQYQDKFAAVAGPGFWNDPDMPNYAAIAKYCNIWRNWSDIQDAWQSVLGILSFYGADKTNFIEVAGPGNFNDPDMLIIGNYGLSWDQQRVQMALWSIMASPLIMSTDLRSIKADPKSLLLNKYAIQINQDPMGIQGRLIKKLGNVQVWTRPISPKGSFAFAFMNTGTGGTPSKVNVKISDLGMTAANGYTVFEVYENTKLGSFKPTQMFNATVNPTGVFFGKAMVNN